MKFLSSKSTFCSSDHTITAEKTKIDFLEFRYTTTTDRYSRQRPESRGGVG